MTETTAAHNSGLAKFRELFLSRGISFARNTILAQILSFRNSPPSPSAKPLQAIDQN